MAFGGRPRIPMDDDAGAMPLAEVEPGRDVQVVAVRAGRGLCARLAAMGILPGVEISVVSNAQSGPLVVAVKDSRVMLGRGMAEKIAVR